MVGTDKEPPTGAVNISYFVGFFLTPAGATIYLDLVRGLCVVPNAQKVYNFTTTKTRPNEFLLEYKNSSSKDLVRASDDSSIVIMPYNNEQAQTIYTRLK